MRPGPISRRRRRGLAGPAAALATVVLVALLGASPARAATGPGLVTPPYGFPYANLAPYAATPPTKGALASDGPTNRYLLDGTWLYEGDPNNLGLSAGWQNQASSEGWVELTVPNAWNTGDFSQGSSQGGIGWYRRDFTLPAGAFPRAIPKIAQSWTVTFESVNYRATVWLNGRPLGTHTGAYLPFTLPLKGLRAGVNRLVVRVDDRRGAGDFPPGPQAGWWNFGGILDAVYLQPVARAALQDLAIHPVLPCPTCTATVSETATVRNLSPRAQTVTLSGTYGTSRLSFGTMTIPPGGTWMPVATTTVRRPKLWAPGSPNLYPVTAALTDTHRTALGGYRYLSGIRSVTRTADGLLELNGRQVHLRGVNLHEQTVSSGAALSLGQMAQFITWAKQLGATMIRAHYPLDPELEQMADQAGILLWSEVPVYQLSATTLTNASVRAAAVNLLAANIAANGNHPAIALWSIGNELPTPPTPGEAAYVAAAAARAHALDPSRPVAMAVSNWPGVACQAAYAPLDVIGINEYFGWFDAGGGATDDINQLGPYLQTVRQCYPTQALMVSEFGYGGNRNGPAEVRGTYAYQQNQLGYTESVFASLPWLAGALYFPLQDFAVEPGYDGSDPLGTPPYVDKGMLDQYGAPKPAFGTMAGAYDAVHQVG